MPTGTPKSSTTARKTTAKRTTTRKIAPKRAKKTATKITDDASGLFEKTDQQGFPPPTEAERQAKLQAYGALKSAGVHIPQELADEVESWIRSAEKQRKEEEKALEKEQAQISEENETGPWWIRNCFHGPFSLRLERQEKKKRIDLKPRGQRGDLFPLKDGDLDDATLQTNLNTGFIEVVPNGEAKNILSKQTQNLQRTHVPFAILRNEKGEPYQADQIKVEAEFNSQGVVVAYEDPSIGKQHENVKWAGGSTKTGLIRAQPGQDAPAVQPQGPQQITTFVPTGGNPAIISSGFHQTPEARARIADDLARRTDIDGPAAGIGGLAVTVAPVQPSPAG